MSMRILILAYGNPTRLDDGLGPAFAEALEANPFDDDTDARLTIEIEHQLHIEHALLLCACDIALFVDATINGPDPFAIERVTPIDEELRYTTHALQPGGVVAIAARLFDAHPHAYLLGIRGYDFEGFGQQLSGGAAANLDAALHAVRPMLQRGCVEPVAAPDTRP